MASQPSLLGDVQRAERPRKRVRPTSVAAYAQGRDSFRGRKADVLRWLAGYFNFYQSSPTSAELARWSYTLMETLDPGDWTARVLLVRRGLSDLQRPSKTVQGTVQAVKAGSRVCQVTGRTCCTWAVIERGTR